MKRSTEQIQEAMTNIRSEIQSLPPESAFGDSNDEALSELQAWLVALQKAQDGQPSGNEVVDIWLDGKWSEIDDYCNW